LLISSASSPALCFRLPAPVFSGTWERQVASSCS